MTNQTNQNASITHVAALAKVSIATVSRVLSGRRAKDDDIAKRVRKAAEQLNYSVNYAASALRSDTTNTIGVVIGTSNVDDSFSVNMLSALDEAAHEIDKILLVGTGKDAEAQEERIEELIGHNVDSLIVIPSNNSDLTKTLENYVDNLPIVQIGGTATSFHVNWVGMDQESMMEAALIHLSHHDAHNIAYLSGNVDSTQSANLFANFQTAASRLSLLSEPDWTTFGELTYQRGFKDTMRLFSDSTAKQSRKPDAVICANDAVALGALLALDELSLQVPQDVLVIGYGDSRQAEISEPKLSSIRPPYQQIAREAIRLTAVNKSEQHWLPAHMEFRPEIMRRESTNSPRIGTSDMSLPWRI